jgi:putative colanic acid biosysnthesis UDP-glucose lipid carrier transferase
MSASVASQRPVVASISRDSGVRAHVVRPAPPLQLTTVATPRTHSPPILSGTTDSALRMLLRYWLTPVLVTATLLVAVTVSGRSMSAAYVALAVSAFFISRHMMSPLEIRDSVPAALSSMALFRLLGQWAGTLLVVFVVAAVCRILVGADLKVMVAWIVSTPFSLLLGTTLACAVARNVPHSRRSSRRYIIIGLNEVGLSLNQRIASNAGPDQFLGYFDFRSPARVTDGAGAALAGNCADAVEFVKRHKIHAVYIALPLARQQRLVELIDALRDTVASVYFAPDLFAFEVVQPRIVYVGGMPVYSVRDTPMQGTNALLKRSIDLAVGGAGLLILCPVMLAIAVAIRLSSPGPALFKQRRYGLDGDEIMVYKFRSMVGNVETQAVAQATRGDARVTVVGRLLRRNSLDELPQLFNVMQGTMSIVGPRPHAVAHNEQYRRLIGGYMMRHKVRPGITGWAQVNGWRGETDTVDKMRSRVEHDLEYLRTWSVWLDLKIILRTFRTVLTARNAY